MLQQSQKSPLARQTTQKTSTYHHWFPKCLQQHSVSSMNFHSYKAQTVTSGRLSSALLCVGSVCLYGSQHPSQSLNYEDSDPHCVSYLCAEMFSRKPAASRQKCSASSIDAGAEKRKPGKKVDALKSLTDLFGRFRKTSAKKRTPLEDSKVLGSSLAISSNDAYKQQNTSQSSLAPINKKVEQSRLQEALMKQERQRSRESSVFNRCSSLGSIRNQQEQQPTRTCFHRGRSGSLGFVSSQPELTSRVSLTSSLSPSLQDFAEHLVDETNSPTLNDELVNSAFPSPTRGKGRPDLINNTRKVENLAVSSISDIQKLLNSGEAFNRKVRIVLAE